MEEKQVEQWNDMENTKEKCNLFKFTLCPTVRGNNSVYEGITP